MEEVTSTVKRMARGLMGMNERDKRMDKLKRSILEEETGSRVVFQKQVRVPWYSLSRRINMVIVSLLGVSIFYYPHFINMQKGSRLYTRLEQEREAFIKELDQQEILSTAKGGAAPGTGAGTGTGTGTVSATP
jgi:hypothetical protein